MEERSRRRSRGGRRERLLVPFPAHEDVREGLWKGRPGKHGDGRAEEAHSVLSRPPVSGIP